MHKLIKQLITIAAMLALAAPSASAQPRAAHTGQDSLGDVALLPLDDRPYTWYDPIKLGGAAGYDIETPGRAVLGRHFTPGDGDAAASWLLKASHKTDDTVVALPMLAYGGLLNSRSSAVPKELAMQRLEAVRKVKAANPNKRLYAFDTIMRLTPEGPWRTQLRKWATLKDEVENLGQEEKRADLAALEDEIPEEVRSDYLATRKRNHEINLKMIEWAAEGVFDYLVIGQDDASGTGLHRPEALALKQRIQELGVEDKVVLYPGADVVASLLLAKIAVEEAGVSPSVYVEYSRVPGDEWTAPYQNIPYADLIEGYVRTIGGHMTIDIDDADVVLMANTGGSSTSVAPFADRIAQYVSEGRNVAVGDDAIAGRTDTRLFNLLDPQLKRTELSAYSGWNIGIPIALSLGREALYTRAEEGSLPPGASRGRGRGVEKQRAQILYEAAEDSLELTLSEWVQTNSYRSYVRNDTTAYARQLGEADPQNIKEHFDAIQAYAVSHTTPLAQTMFDQHFADVARPAGRLDGNELTITPVAIDSWNLYLPWLRTGEIAAEPEVVWVP